MKHILHAASAMLLCIAAHPAEAGDYYVRTGGSDSNPGTSAARAFRTIDRAANVMSAGDRVFVGAGVYAESVTPVRSGTSSAPIRFIADVNGAQTGDAGLVVILSTRTSAISINRNNYIHFDGFTIANSRNAVRWINATGGQLTDCTIIDSRSYGLFLRDASLEVRGCTISGTSGHGVRADRGADLTISDSQVLNNSSRGVLLRSAGISFALHRSVIAGNGSIGLDMVTGTALITNALIVANGHSGVRVGSNDRNDITLWHSTLANNRRDGIEMSGGTLRLFNSIAAFNGDDGVDINRATATHTYNIVYGNSGSAFQDGSPDPTDMLVDPQFAGSNDYRLRNTSPALNAAPPPLIASLFVDINSVPRPIGTGWDVGCYEGVVKFLFTDVTAATSFATSTTPSVSYGSGWHWADFDNDGDLDAWVTGHTARYLRNNSNGNSFTVSASVGSVRRQAGIIDIDNDGDLDLWLASINGNNVETLFENIGNAAFIDAGHLGMNRPSNNEGVAIGDVNHDGLEDVVMFSSNGNWIGHNTIGSPAALTASDDRAYGMMEPGDFGNGDYVSSGDVNNDGYIDFFYHYGNGKLFLSNADGTYTQDASDISVVTGNNDKIGSAWGDYDNDGDLDLFVPRLDEGQPSTLWRNDNGTFVNVAAAAGISDTSSHRSAAWGDYDNDGDLDLYVVTAGNSDNLLYRNNRNGTFTVVNEGAGATGNGHDAVFVDYDNDGDLDLAVARENSSTVLLRNDTDDNAFLKVRVIGAGAGATSASAVGIRVELLNAGGSAVLARRDVGVARGYGGTEPLWLHFGGLDHAATYIIRVHFNTGVKDVTVVPRDVSTTIASSTIAQMLTVVEDASRRSVVRWQEVDPTQ
ncbi:MAG: FG-GAP-like repeat-containing protein [Phycisphaerales bacterium]